MRSSGRRGPALSEVARWLTGLLGLGLVFTGLLAAPDSASAAASRARTATSCLSAAHRGGGSVDTENGLGALRSAVAHGADYLEMDVQVTRDGTFVLMHDQTIDRTTDGSGRILDQTAAELTSVRLLDGEAVPTLQHVLDMAVPTGVGLLIELKWVPSGRFAALKAMIDGFGASRVVVNSLSPYVVSTFHARYPDVRAALDTSRMIGVGAAASYGGVMPDHRHVTLRWLARLRSAGVPTYLWTVDSRQDWARYSGKVTLMLTDRPQEYRTWRSGHCA